MMAALLGAKTVSADALQKHGRRNISRVLHEKISSDFASLLAVPKQITHGTSAALSATSKRIQR
jgi:hypothetical protein